MEIKMTVEDKGEGYAIEAKVDGVLHSKPVSGTETIVDVGKIEEARG